MSYRRGLASLAAAACLFSTGAWASPASGPAAAPLISTADFAQRPAITDPKLSPDGTKVLTRLSINGEEHLGIVDLTGAGGVKALSLPKGIELEKILWAGNNRVLISVGRATPLLGEETYVTTLAVYDIATGKPTAIGTRTQGPVGDDILFVDPNGEYMLLSLQKSLREWPSVQRVDLSNGKMHEIEPAREKVVTWWADRAGVVRAALGVDQLSWFLLYRRAGTGGMREVLRYKYQDRDAKLGIMNFVVDNDDGFIGLDKTGRDALYRYNFASNTVGEKVFEHPSSDLEGLLLSNDGRNVQGVTYIEDQHRVKWLDARLAAVQAELDASFPGRQARIVSRSNDDQKFIIWAGTSSDPGRYFYQNRATGEIKLLADVNEKLRKAVLSPSRYVNYTARDGTTIYGYLTLPAGRDAKNLPLIIVPHGGPYGVRDSGSFDGEIQFLANRGYAVLQPNYRGSSSYGTEFAKKGEGQWGRKMQDDIDDGMDWLAKAGTVDPKRVCIVGSSYGGYAALWGATRNPERYRCAASFAGVSDVDRQVRYARAFMDRRGAKSWLEKVRGEDRKFDLGTISPLSTVARLKVPVLITHGNEDQRVPLKQSTLYVKALQEAGKVHEFKLYEGEGHGFSKSENYKDYLDRLEAFLAKYNPAT